MTDDWPDCPVPGCPNKICLSLDSYKCFPHTEGNQHVKRWKIEARYIAIKGGEIEIYEPMDATSFVPRFNPAARQPTLLPLPD